jgi:hypothetical protein
MNKRETWKSLRLSAADEDIQRRLGKTAGSWRWAVANRARGDADSYAKDLIDGVTPRLVLQRLLELDEETIATITRLFGGDLSDALNRARVFEVCDFVCWDGGDEDRLHQHQSISLARRRQ